MKLNVFKIPIPSLEIQKQLVEEMEKEEEMITANKKLIGLKSKVSGTFDS